MIMATDSGFRVKESLGPGIVVLYREIYIYIYIYREIVLFQRSKLVLLCENEHLGAVKLSFIQRVLD